MFSSTKFAQLKHCPFSFHQLITFFVGFCVTVIALAAMADAQIDGFTEPLRRIDLSSDESGSISELLVKEAEFVSAGTPIVRLDSRVQELQLEIAAQLSKSRSQLEAAQEAYNQRVLIAEKLESLKEEGHASAAEILRAEMELSIAKSKLLSAQEEVEVRELERRRAEVQLERRTVVAPFDAVVAKIHSREGEFLSPVRPEIVTLVQIDQLIATFAVPTNQIKPFSVGKEFNIHVGEIGFVTAKVHSVGVETDAQSGTIEVKMIFDNPDRKYRSGEICTLNL